MKQMRRLRKRQRSIDMEQKKYELTKETMCFDGVTLHRIQYDIIALAIWNRKNQ